MTVVPAAFLALLELPFDALAEDEHPQPSQLLAGVRPGESLLEHPPEECGLLMGLALALPGGLLCWALAAWALL